MITHRRAFVLGAFAAGCSSGGGGPPQGWLVPIPGGGYVRTFAPLEPFSSGCEGRDDGEAAFLANAVGIANNEWGEAVAIALKSRHASVEAFSNAASRRFDCGVSGFGVSSRLEGEPDPCDRAWREEQGSGRRLKWIDARTRADDPSSACTIQHGVALLWESDASPLRISVWARNGGRAAALRRAETLAATYTATAPG